MYYHFLGGITTEKNFDLILSFDDQCFADYHFVSGFGSAYIQFTQKQN